MQTFIAIQMLATLLVSCGSGDPTGSSPDEFVAEFEIISAPTGVNSDVVKVDSVAWRPLSFRLTPSDELEVDGSYEIHFRNDGDRKMLLHYDLRFLDRDGIFVDAFIPFGLPFELSPRQIAIATGEFTIRSTDLRHPDDLRTMQITATIAFDGTTGDTGGG